MPDASDGLYLHRDSPVHHAGAAPKVVGLVLFLLVVVATGAGQWPAFLGYAVLLAGVVALARLPLRTVARRMVVEVPFVVFALVLPFVATGERVDLGPVSVSESGLQGAGVLLARATLGVLAGVVLASTTRATDLIRGLQQLHLPRQLVAIAGFMVRYAAVVVDDLRRMRIARESRGFEGRTFAHARVEAQGVGTLFVRSYERGERVHLAMLARGYEGRMPALAAGDGIPLQWGWALALPAAALLLLVVTR